MKPEFQLFDRRQFLGVVSKTAALFGLTAGASKAAAGKGAANPFAYDLSRFQTTDPKLIAYEEVARWRCARKEPKRIALGPDGGILVCAGNYVSFYAADGRPGREFALVDAACCVGMGKNGTVFVGLRDHVEVFDDGGKRRAVWDAFDRKSWLTALAVGEQDVFVADAGKRLVLRYDTAGKLKGRIGEKDAERNVPGFIVPSPYLDVVIHPDGLLRVNNPGRHQVEAYTFDGDFEGAWGVPSAGVTGFCGCCNPIAIALLSDGRIVTSEKGLPRVKIYSAAGEFESVVAGTESFPENAKACNGLNDCTHGGLDTAADAQGRIYILDIVTAEVRVMKRKG